MRGSKLMRPQMGAFFYRWKNSRICPSMIFIRRVRASMLAHAICGVIISLSLSLISRSGLSARIGSAESTSSPAAAIVPASLTPPRDLSPPQSVLFQDSGKRRFFHFCKRSGVHKPFRIGIQRRMHRHDVRLREQRIKIYSLVSRLIVFSGGGIVEHPAPEHARNVRHSSADRAKTVTPHVFPLSS